MEYICPKGHIFIHPAKIIVVTDNFTLESSVCPHCQTIVYTENKQEQRIVSVVSVDLDAVDAKLAEGYVVEALYAKTATLVKKTAAAEG